MSPQNAAVLASLRLRGKRGLTPLESLRDLGVMRLAGRIHELRGAGFPIESETVTTANGSRIARYRLVETPVQQEMAL